MKVKLTPEGQAKMKAFVGGGSLQARFETVGTVISYDGHVYEVVFKSDRNKIHGWFITSDLIEHVWEDEV